MKMYGGVDGGEWSALRPCRFTTNTHWLGGWVGLRDRLDLVEKRKSYPAGNRIQAI
jgi:hypothetical protein